MPTKHRSSAHRMYSVEDFQRDGYVIITDAVFEPEIFRDLQEFADARFVEAEAQKSGRAPQLIDCPHWADTAMFRWLFSDELLDLVEPLTGPDIGLFACHFLRKPPGTGKRVPWHEDSAYWHGRLEPMEVTSLNLALCPSTPANGCMRVIPGTHVHGYSDYTDVADPGESVFQIEIEHDQVDETLAKDLELAPNQASIHDVRIIHGSNPNTGSDTRCMLAVRYFPAHVRFNPDANPNFQIYLARGRDLAGNPYSDPEKTYAPAGML